MLDERSSHYRTVAARLREMAGQTQFGDMRDSYLKLAYQFDRLAHTVERARSAADTTGLGAAATVDPALRRERASGSERGTPNSAA